MLQNAETTDLMIFILEKYQKTKWTMCKQNFRIVYGKKIQKKSKGLLQSKGLFFVKTVKQVFRLAPSICEVLRKLGKSQNQR